MVATAEEDSRLFLHHQQREPEYARGKPYQPYPVVVLTLVHDLPMFVSQLMINLWNTEGIRFCFFLWNSANDHECQSKCLRICNQYCCLSETWFMQPDPSFFTKPDIPDMFILKRWFELSIFLADLSPIIFLIQVYFGSCQGGWNLPAAKLLVLS